MVRAPKVAGKMPEPKPGWDSRVGERADRIGEFWGYPESRAFAELLIDCEEDRTLRAVLVGMLREATARSRWLARPHEVSGRHASD